MNQKFLAKLRNALGIVALLGALMGVQSASAQNYLPPSQAIPVVQAALNSFTEIGTAKSGSDISTTPMSSTTNKAVSANDIESILMREYLRLVLIELNAGQGTGVAVNNVYIAISQMTGASSGTRMATLDAVKLDVIDLLSN